MSRVSCTIEQVRRRYSELKEGRRAETDADESDPVETIKAVFDELVAVGGFPG